MDKEEIRPFIKETVKETLVSLGIEACDPADMQRDFLFLREMRLTVNKAKSKGVLAVVGVLAVGLLGLIWLGIKAIVGF